MEFFPIGVKNTYKGTDRRNLKKSLQENLKHAATDSALYKTQFFKRLLFFILITQIHIL